MVKGKDTQFKTEASIIFPGVGNTALEQSHLPSDNIARLLSSMQAAWATQTQFFTHPVPNTAE